MGTVPDLLSGRESGSGENPYLDITRDNSR